MPKRKTLESKQSTGKQPRSQIMILTGDRSDPREAIASWNLKNRTWSVDGRVVTPKEFVDALDAASKYWLPKDEDQTTWQTSHTRD